MIAYHHKLSRHRGILVQIVFMNFQVNPSGMTLSVTAERTVGEIQKDFSEAYPYLRIEFYKGNGKANEKIAQSSVRAAAGLDHNGQIEIDDSTTVGALEAAFRDKFGLKIQVARRSGILWLETTMTDKWTLKQQNDHGMELSQNI